MPDYKPTIIVDFDGVLHSYTSGWQGADVIPDPPVPGAFEFLAEAVEHFKVAIFSSRTHQGGVAAMHSWLESHGLPSSVLEQIEFPSYKPPAVLQIDDRSFLFEGMFPSMDFIQQFKPWNLKEEK